VLPHLKIKSPTQLIEALRQGIDTFQGAEEEGTDKSLTVSLDYSFAKLSERARQHLPFLAFFCERVSAELLAYLSNEEPGNPFTQPYLAIFGENLQKHDWLGILNEALDAGILENLVEVSIKFTLFYPGICANDWLNVTLNQPSVN
jgi:hypothetical protein